MNVRIGIVGYGERGRALASEIETSTERARLVAVVDPSPRSRELARTDFPGVLIADDLDAAWTASPDALIVATPDFTHADVAARALEAGVAVFCEKPMATSIEDCDRMLDAAFRHRTPLYIGHNLRHLPAVTLMRELVQAGRIGDVKAVWCRHFVGNGGDWYFKDWHADRSRSLGLLLQKGAHDIDVIHWLAGAYSTRVQAFGTLAVYGDISDRRDPGDRRMSDWYSAQNWPPTEAKGLNPVVDVEDLSQMNMILTSGALASYAQCHFAPDNWRNYTVIGTRGRIENFGDSAGASVGLWNTRHTMEAPPDEVFVVPEAKGGHGGADTLMIAEFIRFVRDGIPTKTSPVAARNAVAAGATATRSLRGDGGALAVPPLDAEIEAYFDAGQPGSRSTVDGARA